MWFPLVAYAAGLIGAYYTYSYVNTYRRTLEYFYIALKADFDICGVLNQTQTQLLTYLQNREIFSGAFVDCFLNDDPLKINDTDPEQVVTIKTILGALNNAEQSLRLLLDTDIGRDRNMPSICLELVPKLIATVGLLGTELNTLNQSSADVEMLIRPYLAPLIAKLEVVRNHIDANNIPAQSLGQAMQLFPESNTKPHQGLENLSKLIYQLPVYFQELQDLIDPGSIQNLTAHDSKALKKKTNLLVNNLKKMATSKDFELLPSGLSTVNLLLQHLPTLLSSTGELTKTSHEKLQALLKELKHNQLPGFIAELETMEEHFSLRPNGLVAQVLTPMNKFYDSVASLSKYCVDTSNVLRNPVVQTVDVVKGIFSTKSTDAPDILCDDTFIDVVQNKRVARWIEANYIQHDTSLSEAAERFFKTANTIDVDDRAKLEKDYQLIQPYYAKLYPEMDLLFVNDFSSWLDQCDSGNSTIALLKQTRLNAAFKCKVIEANSKKHDQLYRGAATPVNFNQLLEKPATGLEIDRYALKMTESKRLRSVEQLRAVGHQSEYKPPLYRALADKPSEKLTAFIQGDLKNWLEKNVDPVLFSKLSFDPKQMIDSTVVDYQIQAHADIPAVLFYKKLLCSLAMIQQELAKMEARYEGNKSSTRLAADAILGTSSTVVVDVILDKEMWSNLGYANGFIREAVSSPELRAILGKGLDCLEPLKNIPAVSGYLDLINAKINNPVSEQAVQVDMVARWKEQLQLVDDTLARLKPVVNPIAVIAEVYRDPAETPNTAEDELLQNILKSIYKIPRLIRPPNPDRTNEPDLTDEELRTKATALIDALTIAKYDVETLQSILSSIDEINSAISEVGDATKEALIAAENKLRHSILSTADEAEFKLGYKPGALTTSLGDTLNSLLRDMLLDFPLSIKEKVALISNVKSVDERIEREKQRLAAFPEACATKVAQMNAALGDGYKNLRILRGKMEKRTDPSVYLPADKYAFLQAYQTLQPYLVQIKSECNVHVFLRELQTDGDFKQRFDEIQDPTLKGRVFGLVEQEKNGYQDMERRCRERIHFLEQLKQTQAGLAEKAEQMFTVDLQLDEAFKEGDRKLNTKIQSNIAPHRDPVLNAFKSVLYAMKFFQKSEIVEEANLITVFGDVRTQWNEVFAKQIRERAEQMPPPRDMKATITREVKLLYSEYSCMINIYKQLDLMSEHIKTSPSNNTQLNVDRMAMINELKAGLLIYPDSSDTSQSLRERLKIVATRGVSDDCKALFEKESDPFFLRHFRNLLKLFGWINPVHRLSSELQKKFAEFKSPKQTVESPDNQNPAPSA